MKYVKEFCEINNKLKENKGLNDIHYYWKINMQDLLISFFKLKIPENKQKNIIRQISESNVNIYSDIYLVYIKTNIKNIWVYRRHIPNKENIIDMGKLDITEEDIRLFKIKNKASKYNII